MLLEHGRCAADAGEIRDQRLAARTRGEVALELVVAEAVDVIVQQVVVAFAVHPVLVSSARSFMRALCTWDFEVPSDTPRISAISRCSNPSTSCRRNAVLHPCGSVSIARSRSIRLIADGTIGVRAAGSEASSSSSESVARLIFACRPRR